MASRDRIAEHVEQQLRQACDVLSRQLRAGASVTAETVLHEFPAVAAMPEAAQELIYTEFVVREELGESPDPEACYERFPHWRDELKRLFQVHKFLREAERDSLAVLSTPPAQARGSTARNGGPDASPPQIRSEGAGHRGTWIGNYEILHEIGRGGMGVVYKARQAGLNRIVALKMLLAGDFATADELARFRHESEAAARLQHPNIVRVYEVGTQDGFPYFSLEYVEGGNLQKKLADGPLRPRIAAWLAATLARAAHSAHEMGIVHRDLKPSNILLQQNANGEPSPWGFCPKIADFGLAKSARPAETTDDGAAEEVTEGVAEGVTYTGAMLGTPDYMAPEQAAGDLRLTDRRADVWALGAMLYEMLTGRRPFQASNPLATLEHIRLHEPVRPRSLSPSLPRELETICLKCLEKDPRRRYATADALAADLDRYLAGKPISASPAGWWERTYKWSRRRPALAALIVTAAVGFMAVTWQWRRAEVSRAEATRAAGLAKQASGAERAERERVERLLYTRKVALSHREYLAHNTIGSWQLLQATSPEMRHWEWHFLQRFCRSEQLRLEGHSSPVRALSVSPDGKWIASAGAQWGFVRPGEIKVWNADTGELCRTLRGHPSAVMSVAFSPDSRRLASAGVYWHSAQAGEVRVWDLEDGQAVLLLDDSDAGSVAFSPDGSQLAVGHSDGRVSLHDSETGLLQHRLAVSRSAGDTFEVAYHPDGTRLASAHNGGAVYLWDARDGRRLAHISGLDSARCLAFQPDGRKLAVGTFQGYVKLYSLNTNDFTEMASFSRTTSISRLAFSPDGQRLAVVTTGAGVELWDASTGRIVKVIHGHEYDAAFSPNGRRLITGGRDLVVRAWDLTAEPFPYSFTDPTSTAWVAGMDLSPDGRYLAVAPGRNRAVGSMRGSNALRIWDTTTRSIATTIQGHDGWLTDVKLHPAGKLLASSGEDGMVRIWDRETGEERYNLTGHTSTVCCIAFSPDGRQLVSAGEDGALKLWDVQRGSELQTFCGPGPPMARVAFHPSGRYLVSVGGDKPVCIWDVATGQALVHWGSASPQVTDVAFSRQGDLLAVADVQGHIQLRELAPLLTGEQHEVPRVLKGHTEQVVSLGFSRDGRRLATASRDGCVKIWDVASGYEVLSLKAAAGANSRVMFADDGHRLLLSHSIHVELWDTRPEASRDPGNEVQRMLAWHARKARLCADRENWLGVRVHLHQCDTLLADQPVPNEAASQPEKARTLAQLFNRIAWLLVSGPADSHDAAAALPWIERSVALNPVSRYSQNTLGVVYYRLQRYEEATSALETAIRLGSKPNADDLFFLAMSQHRLGNKSGAAAHYLEALRWCRSHTVSSGRQAQLLRFRAEAEALLGAEVAAQGLAMEAETLCALADTTDGSVVSQPMQQWGDDWSGGQQLFWRPSRPSSRLILTIDAPRSGDYSIVADVTRSWDYGQWQAYLQGRPLGKVYDGYHSQVARADSIELGIASLEAGPNRLEIEIVGRHPDSRGYFVGLDSLRLVPAAQ